MSSIGRLEWWRWRLVGRSFVAAIRNMIIAETILSSAMALLHHTLRIMCIGNGVAAGRQMPALPGARLCEVDQVR